MLFRSGERRSNASVDHVALVEHQLDIAGHGLLLLKEKQASIQAMKFYGRQSEGNAERGDLGELRRAVGGVDRVDDGLLTADDDEPLHGQRARGDPVRGQLDDFGVGDGRVGDLRRAHRSGFDERRGDRAQRNLGGTDGVSGFVVFAVLS